MKRPHRKRVRLGIVGAGRIAGVHSEALDSPMVREIPVHIERRRVAATTRESARVFGSRFGWSATTDDWRRVTRAGVITVSR